MHTCTGICLIQPLQGERHLYISTHAIFPYFSCSCYVQLPKADVDIIQIELAQVKYIYGLS